MSGDIVPSEIEKAYVAGFVDGEGCISINKHPQATTSFYVYFDITNTNMQVLEYIQSLYGGVIRERSNFRYGNRQHCYGLYWYSKDVTPVLRDLLPYLRVKKNQAVLALEFLLILRQQAQEGRSITSEKVEVREEYFVELRDMNRRGA